MKKFLAVAIAATTMLAFSCNPKNEKETSKEKKMSKDDSLAEDEDDGSSDLKKAAAGYCECFNQNFGDLSPKVKKMLIKAGNSDDPMATIQQEAMEISDPEEQQAMSSEMQEMSNSKEMDACTKKINKKYGLKENDKKIQKLVLKELEKEEDCEILAALLKIGLSQNTNSTEDNSFVEEPGSKGNYANDDDQ